jgi:hypothetical protein
MAVVFACMPGGSSLGLVGVGSFRLNRLSPDSTAHPGANHWRSRMHQSSPSSDAIAGATKLQFNRRELDQAAAAQRVGEAIAYNELESKYSQPIVKFRESHKSVTRAWRG